MEHEQTGRCNRHRLLRQYIEGNPFLTDEQLAQILGVSIQTIRLDRSELNIPEMRERVKNMARGVYGQVRALTRQEMVGELVDLNLGRDGISILQIAPSMCLRKTGVASGQYLFAQANTLAVALIDAPVALTGTAKVSFKRPVFVGENVVARAYISRQKGNKYMVRVSSTVGKETVFTGKFLVFVIPEEEWRR